MTDIYNYYTDVYRGADIPEDDFVRFCKRAEDIVNALVFGRLGDCGDDDSIKQAVCAQTEFMYLLGEDCLTGNAGVSHEELGSAAVTYEKDGCIKFMGMPVSPVAAAILSSSGAAYRGI